MVEISILSQQLTEQVDWVILSMQIWTILLINLITDIYKPLPNISRISILSGSGRRCTKIDYLLGQWISKNEFLSEFQSWSYKKICVGHNGIKLGFRWKHSPPSLVPSDQDQTPFWASPDLGDPTASLPSRGCGTCPHPRLLPPSPLLWGLWGPGDREPRNPLNAGAQYNLFSSTSFCSVFLNCSVVDM